MYKCSDYEYKSNEKRNVEKHLSTKNVNIKLNFL